ncbi:MAG: hypothetical protein ACLU1W_05000 [Collinsella sp.]
MNIPETQKDLLAYLDRITRELGSTRAGASRTVSTTSPRHL